KCRDPGLCFRVVLVIAHQHADAPHALGLLRPRHDRPGGRAAEERDERAPPHSITSSARSWNSRLIASPSACAVLGFTTSANLVGCSIARSSGFTPLKIFSK